MKQFLCIILCAVFCLSLLAGCEKPNETKGDSLAQLQQEISAAMLAREPYPQTVYWKSGACYLGVYGDWHAFCIQNESGGKVLQSVGPYTFEHEICGGIYLYRAGEIYGLSSAYEQGLLTEEQLTQLYNHHQQRSPAVFNTEVGDPEAAKQHLTPVPQDRLEQIVAIMRQEDRKANWDGVSGYYGTYGDCVVIHEGGIMAAVSCVQVADYQFWDSAVYSFGVYTQTERMDLPMAYEKGLLSYEDVGLLYTWHVCQSTGQ